MINKLTFSASSVLDVVRTSDVVVLAVKPQNVEEMLRTYRSPDPSSHLSMPPANALRFQTDGGRSRITAAPPPGRTDVMGKDGIKADLMLLSIIAGVPMKVRLRPPHSPLPRP